MTTTKTGAIPDAAVEAGRLWLFGGGPDMWESEDDRNIDRDRTRRILAAAYPAIREAIMQEVADFILREYSEGEDERIIAESIAYYLTIKGIDAVTETEADRE